MYQGTERRIDYINLNKEFIDFKIEIKEFVSGLKVWQKTTTEYRHNLCDKIDKINEKLNLLPCRERIQWYQSIEKRIKWLWIIVSGALLAITGEWIRKR